MRIIKNGREMRILKNGREMKNWQVMKAFYEEGAEIEYRLKDDFTWKAEDDPQWNWVFAQYRVKKEPKTVPLDFNSYFGEPIRPYLESLSCFVPVSWGHAGIRYMKDDKQGTLSWKKLAEEGWLRYHEGEWKPMSRREG